MSSSSKSSSLYTSTVLLDPSAPPLLIQHSRSTLTFKPLIPLCIFSFCTLTIMSCFWLFFYISCFLFPPDSLGFLQWNAGDLRARSNELLRFIFFILLTLFVSRNLTSIHLPLSVSLNSLPFDLIALTSGMHSLS